MRNVSNRTESEIEMAKLIESDNGSESHLKVLISGQSGSGKTSFGVTAPKPLILLSEQQGIVTIRKRAAELGVPVPNMIVMESVGDYRAAVRALHGSKDQPFRFVSDGQTVLECEWPETVVLDSLTDACEIVRQDVLNSSSAESQTGKDGLETFTQRHWGTLRTRCSNLFRAFRDVPVNVVFLCLLDDRTAENEAGLTVRSLGPALPMRALGDIAMACTNVAGILRRTVKKKKDNEENRELEYSIVTNGPSWMKVKPFRPLADVEVADFTSWVNRINATIKQTTKQQKQKTKSEDDDWSEQ